MKETLKIVLINRFEKLLSDYHQDFKVKKNLGDVSQIEIDTSSKLYSNMKVIMDYVHTKYNTIIFAGWQYNRNYTHKEIESARLFQMNIRKWFPDSCGKEHGTIYDHSYACPVCHSGEHQVSSLYLPKGRYMLHRDVIITLGYEIVVSKKFVDMCRDNNLQGVTFGPVYFGKTLSEDYFQLMVEGYKLDISPETKFGVYPCDDSENGPILDEELLSIWKDGIEIYKCPKGDNLGLNILSEAYVNDNPVISEYDFFISRQTYGVYRGLFVPHHLLFCSPRMRKRIIENNIKGFDFEIAHVV